MCWKVRFFDIFYRKKCEDYENKFKGHAALTLRSRLRCIIVRRPGSEEKEYKDVTIGQDNYTVNNIPKPSTNILVRNLTFFFGSK